MKNALTIRDAMEFSREIMSARQMLPDHVRNPGEALAIIMAGQELGLGPMSAFREIILIKGKTTLTAKCLLGLTHAAGIDSHWEESTSEVATLTLTKPGRKPQTFSFSMADARKAQLAGGGNWKKYPDAMLMARCISKATRAVCPEVTMGAYVHGELTDGNALPDDVTPEPAPAYRWPDEDRKWFCANLPQGLSYDQLSAYLEAHGKSRPSAMSRKALEGTIAALTKQNSEALYKVEEWLTAMADDEPPVDDVPPPEVADVIDIESEPADEVTP